VIDILHDDTFAYLPGTSSQWGVFDHKMVFAWKKVPKRELERLGYDNSLPLRFVTQQDNGD
jgi:hypothetical protein